MNATGELIVDENCRTDIPKLFAADDATSIGSKQVGIAASEGIKASLAAYAYLGKVNLGTAENICCKARTQSPCRFTIYLYRQNTCNKVICKGGP
jgi:hypothetical protein